MEKSRLVSILKNPPIIQYPVILPDFFVDHFVLVSKFEDFVRNLETLASQGGGNLLDNQQFIRRGGNCVNTASALLSLGLNPKMIITTDQYGASLLRTLIPPGLDLKHVHTDGRLSTTVSIETEYQNRRINLMVSDSGSASSFKFSDLTSEDIKTIEKSGLVALVNLNHNQDGAKLAQELFQMIKDNTNAKTFMDIGDPSSNPHLVEPLVNRVLKRDLVDILGVNENEVGWVVRALTNNDERWRSIVSRSDDWLPAAETISYETGTRVDLHTPKFSASVIDHEIVSVPAFQVESRVVCGAGDSWNAGNIYGELLDISAAERLILANAVAALYVSSMDAVHPTRTEVIRFLISKKHSEAMVKSYLNPDI